MKVDPEPPAQARLASLSPQQLRQVRDRLALSCSRPQLEPQPRGPDLPQSFAQERLWFVDRLTPTGTAYHISRSVRLEGVLDFRAFEWSFTELVRRHESLRTRFGEVNGRPVQLIDPPRLFRLHLVDLSQLAHPDQSRLVEYWGSHEVQRPFDLHRGPLLRVRLLRLRAAEHELQLSMHHIISDGWSMTVLLRDVSELYTSRMESREPRLPGLAVQYADYALWQRNCLHGDLLEGEISYWRRQLAGVPSVLTLPTDMPRPPVKSFRGAMVDFGLTQALSQSLTELSRLGAATLFMTMLAAFSILMARYSGQMDIVIGAPIAGRSRREVEDLIGFFVNALPLRMDLSGNPSFRQLLDRAKQVALSAFAHQDLPFEKVVAQLQPQRDLSRQPLFQVMLAVQNTPKTVAGPRGIGMRYAVREHRSAQFDLAVDLYDGVAVTGGFEYATDLFERATVERMAGHFVKLLTGIAAGPDRCIWDLPLLTSQESKQLVAWGEPAPGSAYDGFVHELIALWARRTPDSVAVVHGTRQLTYAELECRADRLAGQLQSVITSPETVVGLSADRSVEMIVGLLGILKAGAVFLPLDPRLPLQRRDCLLREADAAVLIVTSQDLTSLCAAPWRITQLNGAPVERAGNVTSLAAHALSPESLAYVIFTSGSTGKPKGVAVPHGALTNKVCTLGNRLKFRPGMRSALVAPAGVDASLEQMCLALVHGGSVIIVEQLAQESAAGFWQGIAEQQVQLLDCVPSFLDAVVDDIPESLALEQLLVGGEKFPTGLYRRLAERSGVRVTNIYGPTEATVDALAYEVRDRDRSEIPIGSPLENYRCHVLDSRGSPVPVGVVGELYLGGRGLARGYLNRPDSTAQSFLPDPLHAGERMYRTGDHVRYRVDGNIEFVGRRDDQLKVRGYRVELGEIEATLREQACVRHAVVLKELAQTGDLRLRAFVVPDVSRLATAGTINRAGVGEAVVQEWTALFDDAYDTDGSARGPSFQGWVSSYTGRLIPHSEMQEWLSTTVQRILALRPARVLEIGCGDGLLLQHLAPHCAQYVGTDISPRVIADLQQWIRGRAELQHVGLTCRDATDLRDVSNASVDTVVINSVVQYFPHIEYLLTALARAMAATADGGRVFVGDVRNLRLLRTFHCSVQLAKATPELSLAQLRRRVDRSVALEKEVLLDPRFFLTLPEYFSRIQEVEILLKRGFADNELTRYRYDVVLHLDRATTRVADVTLTWDAAHSTIQEFTMLLASRRPASVQIRSMPNRRVLRDVTACQIIDDRDGGSSVAALRKELASRVIPGDDAETFWRLAEEHEYQVRASWSEDKDDGSFDVLLTDCRAAIPPSMMVGSRSVPPFDRSAMLRRLSAFANEMVTQSLQYQLSEFLRNYLRSKLPEEMLPTSISLVNELPLLPSGKLDRNALLALLHEESTPQGRRRAPVSAVQRSVADIWRGLLQIEAVALEDDFFELGGHSLMAMRLVARIRQEFAVELQVRVVFENSTLEKLSAHVESVACALEHFAGSLPRRVRDKLAGLSEDEAASLMRKLLAGKEPEGGTDAEWPPSAS